MKTKKLKKFGYDLLPVTIGVLLALLINNFQGNLREKHFIHKVLRTIVLENEQNILEIGKSLKSQQLAIDTLSFYRTDDSTSLMELIRRIGGIHLPDITNSGADFLLNNHQTSADLNMLIQLSKMNLLVNSLDANSEQILNRLYGDLQSTSSAEKERIQLMLSDLINYEEEFLEETQEFNDSYSK